MNIAQAISRVPAHLIPSGRFTAAGRVSVADIPEHIFVGGAELRAAGVEWDDIHQWVRAQGISIAGSTVRNAWSAWMKKNNVKDSEQPS